MSLIIKELLQIGESALEKAGCMDPRIDVELIMRFLLKLDKQQLFIKSPALLDEKTCEAYFKLVDIRAGGMPVQYITGEQEFMGISFKVNENVLIPRQDTETLVEEVIREIKVMTTLKKVPRGGYQLLDLCCGSGAIGVSLCKLVKDVKVTAADISGKAVDVAKENAQNAGVIKLMRFEESDLFASLRKGIGGTKFHVITSNPPYIRREIIPTLQREIVEHEPMIALDGGEDGLDFYRRIVVGAPDYLKPEGLLFMEIGHDQGGAVCALASETERFEDITIIRDLAGHDRVVKCRLKTPVKASRRNRKSK
ncbi:MAG TPA: peptide chain release factor N(5)-glutamine methyltransferase [Anaerovoracaceae bacterium]|nr:peptide chain release factor N(5)-glutamine methyltransferase [Anaerovoracaceae bacterium]